MPLIVPAVATLPSNREGSFQQSFPDKGKRFETLICVGSRALRALDYCARQVVGLE